MSFSLKKYIKDKYLNESIQSDILINEILNDKGGFFKYYKIPFENSRYKRLIDTVLGMQEIISGMCNDHISANIKGYKVEKDEDARYVHEKYNQLLKKYMSTLENIFAKPEPRILASLFSYRQLTSSLKIDLKKTTYVDIYNITDDNFSVYTWDDMQNCDAEEQEEMQNIARHKPVFWIDHTGKIQAFSNNGKILLFAPDNNNSEIIDARGYKSYETSPSDILTYLSREAIEKNLKTYDYQLKDRSILEFKYPKYDVSGGSSIVFEPLIGLRYIKKTYDLTEYSFYHENLFDVDNIYWDNSPIRKYTDWGKHPGDKMIEYKPVKPYNNDGKRSKNVVKLINPDTKKVYYEERDMQMDSYFGGGYNENKHDKNINARKADRKAAFQLSYDSKYRWATNLLGKYIRPYTAFGKDKPQFKFGVSLTDEERYHLYDSDEYCSKLAYDNFKRYRYIIDKQRFSGIIHYDITNELNDILKKTEGLSSMGLTLNERVKQLKRTPQFPDAINLYGMYMKGLQKCLTFISTVLGNIANYKDKYENPKRDVLKSDYEEISPDYKKITTSLEMLRGYITSLKKICDEINAKIKEAE